MKTLARAITPALALCLLLSACAAEHPSSGGDTLHVGGGTIEINLDSNLPLPRAQIVEWVRRAAIAVTNYLGRFPTKHLTITVESDGDEPVGGGVTYGNSRINVRLGPSATAADLRKDWVMTHEMFHLAFPTLSRRYSWMMEGLSDYLEPIARARAGQTTPEDAWREFVEGLPQGLPRRGDRGLDNTHTRERIYWGGNLYWLLADVQIREKTNNRHSVDDAIRAILNAGGTGGTDWPIEQVLSVGDKATQTTVLEDLHNQLGPQPGKVDLDDLWQRLGIKYHNGKITFDSSAPLANIRASITSNRHPGS